MHDFAGRRSNVPSPQTIAAVHCLAPEAGVTRIDETSDLWWKNAIVYCVDVKTFLDYDGDGCGDLPGLTQRVDYLAGLGVTCLWLMPFHPSPRRDDGYDITDFYGVDPDLGSLGDFARFVRMARDRGLRVIVDLVANHTSDCHPWFEAARVSPESPFRDWYIWRDEPPDEPTEVVFPGEEESAWTYDEQAGQYYLHHFRAAQPDLNLANQDLRDEMVKVMGFWLALGVSGFRVDAVPFLVEDREHAYDLLRSMRAFMSRRFGEGILLGENNMPPEEQLEYFGPHGDMLNMQFNFVLNQAMHLAFARADPEPLERALEALPDIPPDAAWANWVRNHDELSLDKLTDEEREEVFSVFGQDPDTRIYGRGLRRRLPSMVDGDERRVRLAYSLMFSLPGTPVLFYGEEIGMAENLEVEGRLAVRPPMQWSAEEHAGFSPRGERELVRPLCGDYEKVNVADQRRDQGSLLNWMERLIRRRRECPEIGWGRPSRVPCEAGVFAHRCDWRGATVVAAHNLTDQPVCTTLRLDDLEAGDELLDLLGDADAKPAESADVEFELPAYGHRWLRIRRATQRVLP
jgi:trehalose synthase